MNTNIKFGHNVPKLSFSLMIALVLIVFLTSCASTGRYDTQKGALAGAGVGAIAGQVIGRSTTSTLIGAGTGAMIGAIIGNAQDQKNQEIRDYEKTQTIVDSPSSSYAEPETPPGKWITVPGRWNGNTWTPSHRRWVPVNPRYQSKIY